MLPDALLPRILLLFGFGFLCAIVKTLGDWLRFRRRRSTAILAWAAPKPRFYGLCLGMAGLLAILVVFKLGYQQRPVSHAFGELMMCVYYGWAFPLATRIGRGFYADGIQADDGFMPYRQITGISWREHGPAEGADAPGHVTLLLISHVKSLARRVDVPAALYGEARTLLRDRIKAHDIQIDAGGLLLGAHDERDSV